MKIDTMRRIDRWAGVPLTFVASVALRIWRLVRPPARLAAEDVRNVIFLELSEMGSAILADPAMRRARRLYPQASLHFVIFAGNRASLSILGTVPADKVIAIRNTGLIGLVVDSVRAIRRMRSLGKAVVIDLELFSRYSALLSFLSGASVRVGFHRFHAEGLYRGALTTHPVPYNPHQHIAATFLAMVRAPLEAPGTGPFAKVGAGEPSEMHLAPYVPHPAALVSFRRRLLASHPALARHPLWVILNPNSSEMLPLRRWPLDRFGSLAAGLLANPAVAVLVTGSKAEGSEARRLIAACNDPRLVDLTGFTTVGQLPLLYSLSAAMVTNDSGPAHFAAPVGLKTFVLFGPETPALYGALNPNAEFFYAGLACSPCVSAANHRKSACRDAQCLKAISTAEVLDRVWAYLSAISETRSEASA